MSDKILLAKTVSNGIEIEACVEWDSQCQDWVAFVSLNGMVPFSVGKPFNVEQLLQAKYHAMRWFNTYDSDGAA